MKQELLLVLALVLDVAGVATIFAMSARSSLRGRRVRRHAVTSPAASCVKGRPDGANRGQNPALSQPEPG